MTQVTQVTPVAIQFTHATAPHVVSVDDTIHDLLGFTSAQFLGGATQWLSLVHPDDHDIIDRLFSPTLTPANGHFNIRIRHADGRIRCWLQVMRQGEDRPRFLRVVILEDGETVHDAFFDRNFREEEP